MPHRPGRSRLLAASCGIALCSVLATACGAQELRNPLRAVGLDNLNATRERPLFSASRRPAAEPPAPVPVAVAAEAPPTPRPAEPAPFLLVGTLIGTTAQIAIARIVGTDEVITLAPGASRNGWSVRAIEARRLSVEKDGRIEDLALGDAVDGEAAVATLAADQVAADAGEVRGDVVASQAPMQQAADAGATTDAAPLSLTR